MLFLRNRTPRHKLQNGIATLHCPVSLPHEHVEAFLSKLFDFERLVESCLVTLMPQMATATDSITILGVIASRGVAAPPEMRVLGRWVRTEEAMWVALPYPLREILICLC